MEEIINSKDYVLKKLYSYNINKKECLKLRNVDDLIVYDNDAIVNAFDVRIKDDVVHFNLDDSECKIIIETVS